MQHLLSVEKMVLECLKKRPCGLVEIHLDTGLDHRFLRNILASLSAKGFVACRQSEYLLTSKKPPKQEPALSKIELKEFFSGLLVERFKKRPDPDTSLVLKKMWLTANERELVNSMLKEIETLLETIQKSRLDNPPHAKTKNQRVFIWGVSPYGTLIENIVKML